MCAPVVVIYAPVVVKCRHWIQSHLYTPVAIECLHCIYLPVHVPVVI